MAGKTLYKFQDVQMILEEDGGYTCRRGEEIVLRSLSWREALCSFFGSAQMQAERRMIKLEEERPAIKSQGKKRKIKNHQEVG